MSDNKLIPSKDKFIVGEAVSFERRKHAKKKKKKSKMNEKTFAKIANYNEDEFWIDNEAVVK